MQSSFLTETEMPGKAISSDTLQIIAHRYYWASKFVDGKMVLEACCGPGIGLGWLARNAECVIGGDLYEKSVSIARKHYDRRVDIIKMDAHKMPFENNSFDAIICVASIIYLDVLVFFSECYRILKKGGLLILNTPNKNRPGFKPSKLSRKYYSIPEICSLLSKCGFNTKFFGAFPGPVGLSRFREDLLSIGKKITIRIVKFLHAYEIIKRNLGFQKPTVILTNELTEDEMKAVEDIEVVPLPSDSPDIRYRIICAVAQAS